MTDDYDYHISEEWCDKHQEQMHYRDCEYCGGEGYTEPGELFMEDPMWYMPDDVRKCEYCEGEGTISWCPECAKEEHLKNYEEAINNPDHIADLGKKQFVDTNKMV